MTAGILHDDRAGLERAVEHYLHACFRARTAVRASELAAELDLTAPYLSRIGAELLREPISDYLRRKQLEYACRLLKATPLTIEDVALSAGFGTPRTLYRAFRETYGMTPTLIGRRLRNDSRNGGRAPSDGGTEGGITLRGHPNTP